MVLGEPGSGGGLGLPTVSACRLKLCLEAPDWGRDDMVSAMHVVLGTWCQGSCRLCPLSLGSRMSLPPLS